jgi:tryptophan-rich sensory protein
MNDVPWIDWYQSLAKPSWTPAPRTIGLIWQILYPVIIATFGYVFVQAGLAASTAADGGAGTEASVKTQRGAGP